MADAAPIVYRDFEFVRECEARFAVQDRGVLFADGVYEVVRFDRGRAFAMDAHVQRLAKSMAGIGLDGVPAEPFAALSLELLERNDLADAKVYWQITRGQASRDFVMPRPERAEPTITLIAYPTPHIDLDTPLPCGSGHLVDDCRWTKCWIKSLMLLPASMAKTEAVRAGAVEAIFERAKPGSDEKHITEGASTNVFIVKDGELFTHPDDGWVLGGITRDTLLRLADDLGIATHDDRPFTRDQMLEADEVFVCSTTQITAITSFAQHVIADGQPGPITRQLHRAYYDTILNGG